MAIITGSGLLFSTNDSYDRITGTSASDTVVYTSATHGVTVSLSLAGGQSTGGSFFDELISIENIIATSFNDTLQGSSGNNILDGGLGNDTVSYSNATTGVSVSLSIAGPQATGAGSDTLVNFENIIGSNFADTLTGSNLVNNVLSGGSGNDLLVATSGNDVLDGGLDADTASYAGFSTKITLEAFGVVNKGSSGIDQLFNVERIIAGSAIDDTIDLSGASVAPATGTSTDLTLGEVVVSGTGGSPFLSFKVGQFENVTGTSFADTILGNSAKNVLKGGGGADFIRGGGGKDTLTGEAGLDTFDFTSLSDSLLASFDTITDYSLGETLNRPGAGTTLNAITGTALTSLTAASIAGALNALTFTANSSRAFKVSSFSGTFIAFNDAVAGFNAASDSIIFLQNYNISATNTVLIA